MRYLRFLGQDKTNLKLIRRNKEGLNTYNGRKPIGKSNGSV